jgi:hypothetical protein
VLGFCDTSGHILVMAAQKLIGVSVVVRHLRRLFLFFTLINPIVVTTFSASAADSSNEQKECRGDCCFSDVVEVGGESLSRRGVATFRYWGLKVYSAALYVPSGSLSRQEVEGDTKKKLILCYHRSISTDRFIENSEKILRNNPDFTEKHLETELKQITDAYIAANEGDTYSITYDPPSGEMKLSFNERQLLKITNRDFARAYFGIWISKYSVGERFTDELMGER